MYLPLEKVESRGIRKRKTHGTGLVVLLSSLGTLGTTGGGTGVDVVERVGAGGGVFGVFCYLVGDACVSEGGVVSCGSALLGKVGYVDGLVDGVGMWWRDN